MKQLTLKQKLAIYLAAAEIIKGKDMFACSAMDRAADDMGIDLSKDMKEDNLKELTLFASDEHANKEFFYLYCNPFLSDERIGEAQITSDMPLGNDIRVLALLFSAEMVQEQIDKQTEKLKFLKKCATVIRNRNEMGVKQHFEKWHSTRTPHDVLSFGLCSMFERMSSGMVTKGTINEFLLFFDDPVCPYFPGTTQYGIPECKGDDLFDYRSDELWVIRETIIDLMIAMIEEEIG